MSQNNSMNKKAGAFVLIGLLASLALGGIIAIKEYVIDKQKPNYVGDLSTNYFYNLNSKNPNCNLNNIKIKAENFMIISDEKLIKQETFKFDPNNPCDG